MKVSTPRMKAPKQRAPGATLYLYRFGSLMQEEYSCVMDAVRAAWQHVGPRPSSSWPFAIYREGRKCLSVRAPATWQSAPLLEYQGDTILPDDVHEAMRWWHGDKGE